MSLLSVCQSVAVRLNQTPPISIFSSTDTFSIELRVLAQEAAADILKAKEWQLLTKYHTVTGDGVAESHALPTDFDRMLKKGNVFQSSSWLNLTPAIDIDAWTLLKLQLPTSIPGFWILLEGQMGIYPIVSDGTEIIFPYISTNIVSGTKPQFTDDTDTFPVSEDLLGLSILYKWRKIKKLEYADDEAEYQQKLQELSSSDKGSRIIATGRPRWGGRNNWAYPYRLGV